MAGRHHSARTATVDPRDRALGHPSPVRSEDVLQATSTPLGGAAYPAGPYRFSRREYLNITSRTDLHAMRAWRRRAQRESNAFIVG